MTLRIVLAGLCLAGSLAFPLAGLAQGAGMGDDVFIAAREAFRVGNRPQLETLARQAQGHVLADYVDYYLLRNGLEKQNPADIQAFIDQQDGNYLGERLRADWLRVLAKQGDWQGVQRHYVQLRNPDQGSSCLGIQARLNQRESAAFTEAAALWVTLAPVPEECQPLMSMVAAQADVDLFWTRVRFLFEVNRIAEARQLMRTLPAGQPLDAKQMELLVEKPPVWLARLPANWASDRTRRELLALAIQRIARNDPAVAAVQLEQWSNRLKGSERAWAWGQIGLHAARRHMLEAIEWYARSHPDVLTTEAAEWRVRAGLRQGNWKAVRQAIEVLPPDLRAKPEWIYWLGRVYVAEGKKAEAGRLFEQIAGQPNFYGNLADEALGRNISVPSTSRPLSQSELAAAGTHPGLMRALALFRLDLRTEAIREWNWAIRSMDDRQLLAAAELARRQQIYDRAINTADRTKREHDYSLRFLAPYSDEVRPAVQQQSLDHAWVYGLMRQESRFITNAKSSAGASGLMQLMPATAKWVAKKIGLKDYDPRRVNDTATNLLLGTSYMRMVLDDLDGHPVLASAAYNAGPGRARRWKADRALEGAVYAETIPFSETRDYVKKVMSNAVYYGALFDGQPGSLTARLGVIPAKPAGDAPKASDLP